MPTEMCSPIACFWGKWNNRAIVSISLYSVKGALVSTVNGELWALGRPLEADCELQLLGFDTAEGRQVMAPILFCSCGFLSFV